ARLGNSQVDRDYLKLWRTRGDLFARQGGDFGVRPHADWRDRCSVTNYALLHLLPASRQRPSTYRDWRFGCARARKRRPLIEEESKTTSPQAVEEALTA